MNSEGAKSNSSSSNRNRDRDRDRDHTSLDEIVPSKAQAKYTAHSGELFAYERLAKEESDEQQASAINKKLALYKPIDSNGLKIEEAKKPETVNVVESSRKVISSETEEDQLKLLQVKKELKRYGKNHNKSERKNNNSCNSLKSEKYYSGGDESSCGREAASIE